MATKHRKDEHEQQQDGWAMTPPDPRVTQLEVRLTTMEGRIVHLEERYERDVRQIELRIGRVRAPQ